MTPVIDQKTPIAETDDPDQPVQTQRVANGSDQAAKPKAKTRRAWPVVFAGLAWFAWVILLAAILVSQRSNVGPG